MVDQSKRYADELNVGKFYHKCPLIVKHTTSGSEYLNAYSACILNIKKKFYNIKPQTCVTHSLNSKEVWNNAR